MNYTIDELFFFIVIGKHPNGKKYNVIEDNDVKDGDIVYIEVGKWEDF